MIKSALKIHPKPRLQADTYFIHLVRGAATHPVCGTRAILDHCRFLFGSLHSRTSIVKMSLAKRRKVSDNSTNVDQDTGSVASRSDDEERGYEDIDSEGPSSQNEEADSSGDESPDTDEEIANAQRQMKSKKTQKRKRRATSPSHFGAALESLLNTNAPSAAPLALKPSVTKRRADEALEIKAKKLLEGEKKEKEEKNHVADVIGGWGGESERSLRKVAQRGGICSSFSQSRE